MTASCGLHELYELLRQLEEANPHLCTSALTVVPRAETPDKHDCMFELQLPIWSDPAMGALLETRLKDAESARAESRAGAEKEARDSGEKS